MDKFEKTEILPEAIVSGIGIVSPLGCTKAEVLDALERGADGIVVGKKLDLSPFASKICAEIRGFDPSQRMSSAELAQYPDPFFRISVCAARAALEDAGIDLSAYSGKVGYVVASCNAGLNSGEAEYRKKFGEDVVFDRNVSTQSEFYSLQKALVAATGVGGECWSVNTACSGSTAAIGLAESIIESGRCDLVLVGGADALSLSNFAGFSAIKVVSPEKIAPFSTPDGMNIGEGAAFWVVESAASVDRRGATGICKIVGHATTGDAHHPTQPDPRGDGVYRTLLGAAADAGVSAAELGCVNAHGSGTVANDRAESKGIAKFLNGADVPTTSTKSYMGHCMGATGILEATCQVLSMNADFIPATLRNVGKRAGCEISALAQSKRGAYDCFISANYAFGGNNAAVVVAKRGFKNSPKKRAYGEGIAITGLGNVSPLGTTLAENAAALAEGKCAIAKIERFDSPFRAGLVPALNVRTLDRRVDFSGMNNISVYATLVAKRALDDAGVKIGRADSANVGITAAVSRGSSETAHMDAVFSTPERRGDVGCFSNTTANSTAGWVSKALEIKGANITLTSGPNGGLQALGYSADVLRELRAEKVVAFAADELYAQQLDGYAKIGNLYPDQTPFSLRSDEQFATVYGEGACAMLLERESSAAERGARVYGTILSFASYEEPDEFEGTNLSGGGLKIAAAEALERAGVAASEIGLIVWSPRGDAQDAKVLDYCGAAFPNVPMITNVFNTGYIESVSTLSTLAQVLYSLESGAEIWRQKTGSEKIDNMKISGKPKYILALATSHIANNFALVCRV